MRFDRGPGGPPHGGPPPRGPRRGGFGAPPPPPPRRYRRPGGCLGPGCLMTVLPVLAVIGLCVLFITSIF